ncbi:MAG TPA: pyruvate, water dikinase regulatory protein [Phycisphaerae bacterium]|nr:pyruvate, water dikinase regulatory protein [Phycisphaerae bacterium]
MAGKDTHTIYIVSDGTCRTCEQVLRAVLVQFERQHPRVIREANVRRPGRVARIVKEAKTVRATIFYTLVSPETRLAMKEASAEYFVPIVDVLGPAFASLYDMFKSSPRLVPGILYEANKAHFDRIDAIDYTLHHDDGCGMNDLDKADVVLVGVSRTSKSSTCFYLAYRGIRAANVPLFPNEEPPVELLRLDSKKVIGTTANADRLQSVREARIHSWGMRLGEAYTDRMAIIQELRAVNATMAKHGWATIDVSYKAIEEVAREVRVHLGIKGTEPW